MRSPIRQAQRYLKKRDTRVRGAFDRLDEALNKGITESREQLRSDILNARRVLSGATVGAAVLSVVAAIAVALGLWPRLSEYR